jgi:ribonuclease J
MEELRTVAVETLEKSQNTNGRDWNAIKGDIRDELSNYLFKKTRRNPMILPVIMEI